ncbi:hypothetical protein AQF52_1061 [Streptomyces venezuelae]|nr:hypothetical protein AQF52_1061 [Streptomyces venezuelae]CUM43059.1 hypothetical protein BN2537_15083 [Streptomyces venezuelae]
MIEIDSIMARERRRASSLPKCHGAWTHSTPSNFGFPPHTSPTCDFRAGGHGRPDGAPRPAESPESAVAPVGRSCQAAEERAPARRISEGEVTAGQHRQRERAGRDRRGGAIRRSAGRLRLRICPSPRAARRSYA